MSNSEFKADKFNFAEMVANVRNRAKAANPKSIRKRGFHRALKRGELWAVIEHRNRQMINDVISVLFSISESNNKITPFSVILKGEKE